MQWDPQAVRAALAAPGEKTSRRLLSELCEDFRREKPEEWKRIEAASYSEPDCAAAQRPIGGRLPFRRPCSCWRWRS